MAKNKEKIEDKQVIDQVIDAENKEAAIEKKAELVDTEEKQEKVVFTNPDYKPEEKEKIPNYFVEPPKSQKQAEFGVKNGRTYKKVDDYHGLYTDTGEVFRLSR